MADAFRLPYNSIRCSSSLLTSVSSLFNTVQLAALPNERRLFTAADSATSSVGGSVPIVITTSFSRSARQSLASFKVHAAITQTEQPKWWEKNAGPNMVDIHSTQEFYSALNQAGDKLVIVEFYGSWCASCRAMFPKLCRTAREHPEILFLKVNFDENKPMCKNLDVKVLPYFHLYHGAEGKVDAFSCSLAKFQKIKDAIQMHSTNVDFCKGNVNGRVKTKECC